MPKGLDESQKKMYSMCTKGNSLFETTKNKLHKPAEAKLIWHKGANRHNTI